MTIIETKKLEQIDSIGIWSQNRIMNMCAHIIMASNEIQKYEKVCGDELDVGEDLFTVLQTAAPLYEPVPKTDLGLFPYEGVLNGVIKVHVKSDLEPNSAVIHHGDTGIKVVFVGLLKQLPAFAQEDYYLNKKAEEYDKKAELFKQATSCGEDKDMTKEERQVLEDRLEYVRSKMMIYSNTCCDAYLALAKEEKEITDKLGDLVLNYSRHSSVEELISEFIVNRLGINLCSVKSINVDRQEDGQIREIKIEFIPSAE